MERFRKFLMFSIIVIFIIICGYFIFNIVNYIKFKNKYSALIDYADGDIELTEELCSMFEKDQSFSYMVKNLKYNENQIENRRIDFVDGMLSYINDDKKLKKIKGIDYNYPEIENGEINCYLSKKDFIKLFKETYNITLTEKDLEENEDYMGAFYKVGNKVLFSKLEKLESDENSLIEIISLNKSENTYEMKANCYYFRNSEELENFRNNQENSEQNVINIKTKTIVFKLNRFNKYFNYSIISIK